MARRSCLFLTCVLALGAVMGLPTRDPARAGEPTPHWWHCNDVYPDNSDPVVLTNIRAQRMRCRVARRIARGWYYRTDCDPTCRVLRFRCTGESRDTYTRVRCRNLERRFRFRYELLAGDG
jgi:hypothetical protein